MTPIKFSGIDIGNPTIKGVLSTFSVGAKITAGGVDIWGNHDQFYFYSQPYEGDFELIVRVESLTKADLYSKAGLMARESLDADSKHVYLLTFPDNELRNNNNGGIEFAYRMHTGGESVAIYPPDCTRIPPLFPASFPNVWLKLKRDQDNFVSFYSQDGKGWQRYSSFGISLNQKLFLGMAVTSHNANECSIAEFSHLELVENF